MTPNDILPRKLNSKLGSRGAATRLLEHDKNIAGIGGAAPLCAHERR
jgi:hypothetical protein